mgnify:CR=1 FL=1
MDRFVPVPHEVRKNRALAAGFVPGLIIFGYHGGRGDRLKYMVIGSAFAFAGNLIISLPHFIFHDTPERFNMSAFYEIFVPHEKYFHENATPST